MYYAVGLFGPNPYKEEPDDPDFLAQPVEHNLSREAAMSMASRINDSLTMSAQRGNTRAQGSEAITFTHALHHDAHDLTGDTAATFCKGCVAALQEMYDIARETREKEKARASGSSLLPGERAS